MKINEISMIIIVQFYILWNFNLFIYDDHFINFKKCTRIIRKKYLILKQNEYVLKIHSWYALITASDFKS